ncbi:PREDICTED: putative fructokinase-8 [Brassica oleracea var. oleracea]|uniref:putative fructokinase-8 n=1 Tax=Brassica oleracea var. oleracea TaxID=109376 RepID=UPI0006A6BF60|nr:PREDICTED: putative fructokinase-8 [Brassica oleracea var. oleracea]
MSLWHPNLKLLLDFHGSTGAGDSFIGAFLSQIVDDQSVLEDEERLRKVLRFSNVCGAITTTKKGAIPALPSDSEALCFLGL